MKTIGNRRTPEIRMDENENGRVRRNTYNEKMNKSKHLKYYRSKYNVRDYDLGAWIIRGVVEGERGGKGWSFRSFTMSLYVGY